MFYSGIDPFTNKEVYVARDYNEKQMQRALLQFARPANAPTVRKALIKAGREDLIGFGRDCLVRPEQHKPQYSPKKPQDARSKSARSSNGRNNKNDRNARKGKRK